MRKKILPIALCVALLLSCLPSVVMAATEDTKVFVGDADAVAGETITVPIMIENVPEFTSFGMTLDYDTDALTLTKFDLKDPATGKDMLSASTDAFEETGTVGGFASKPIEVYGCESDGDRQKTMFTATFKVAETTEDRRYTVSLVDAELADLDGKTIPVSYKGGTIKISGGTPVTIVSVGDRTAKAGGTVTVPVMIENVPEFASFGMKLTYNKDILTLTKFGLTDPANGKDMLSAKADALEATGTVGGFDSKPIEVYGCVSDGNKQKTMFTATFTVADTVPVGDKYEVSLEGSDTPPELADLDGKTVKAYYYPGIITIVPPEPTEDTKVFVGDADAVAGKTITVPIMIENVPEFASFGMTLDYDKDALTLTKFDLKDPVNDKDMLSAKADALEATGTVGGFDSKPIEVYGCESDSDRQKTMFTATFEVAETAENRRYTVSLVDAELADLDGKTIPVSYKGGTIKVSGGTPVTIVSVGDRTAKAGGTVTVPVMIENVPEFASFGMQLTYNKDILTLTKFGLTDPANGKDMLSAKVDALEATGTVGGFDSKPIEVYGCESDGDKQKTMFTATFTVADTVPVGDEYEVSLEDSDTPPELADLDGKTVKAYYYPGTIMIVPPEPTDASNATVTVAECSYTGEALEPALTVTVEGATLQAGTDYTVKYSNNVNAGTTAKAELTFIGNYKGSKTVNFTIAKAERTFTVTPDPVVLPNASGETTAVLTVDYGQIGTAEITAAKESTRFQLENLGADKVAVLSGTTVQANQGVNGKAEVSVIVDATGNYETGTKVIPVTVTMAPIVSVEASASEKSTVATSLEGTTIVVAGMVDKDDTAVTVKYTAVDGIDGGEITLQKKEDGTFDNTTVVVGGLTYTVDASGLVEKPRVEVTVSNETLPIAPADKDNIDDETAANTTAATVKADDMKLMAASAKQIQKVVTLIPDLVAKNEELTQKTDPATGATTIEDKDGEEYKVVVTLSLSVQMKEHKVGDKKLKLDIKPQYSVAAVPVDPKSDKEPITLSTSEDYDVNDPVTVSFDVPAGFLDGVDMSSVRVKHYVGNTDQVKEWLKPTIRGNNLSFNVRSFSDFEVVVGELPSVEVIFYAEDGAEMQTETYTVEDIGTPLPAIDDDKFLGWTDTEGDTTAQYSGSLTQDMHDKWVEKAGIEKALKLYPVFKHDTVPGKLTISGSSSVRVGSTIMLKAYLGEELLESGVQWSSSNKDVATVDNTGTVKGVKKGTVTITATITVAGDDYSDTCTVTVTRAGGGEETSNCTVTIEGGEHATVKNGDDVIGDTIDTSSNVTLTIAPADGYKLDGVKYTIGEDGTETDGEVAAEGTCTITVPAGGTVVSITITATPTQSGEGVTVTGTITSYEIMVGGEPLSDEVTIKLSDGTEIETQTVTDGSFSFTDVSTGTYTLTVSKAGHVTQEYEVEVGSTEVTQDVKINPLGDVTDDGLVDMDDIIKLARYVKNAEKYAIADTYLRSCGNVHDEEGDGQLDMDDIIKLARYVKNSSKYPLYNVEK